jgi:5'-deoxynucleotidase YfbR-like HD superfamily hydrolase
MNVQDWYRLYQVKRFHMIRTNHSQSVAEHSYLVTAIAMEIANRMEINDTNIIKCAILHDRHEVITGDIPTQVKNDDNRRLEHEVDQEVLTLLERMNSTERAIVKLADIMEGIVFLSKEITDAHGRRVMDYLYEVLNQNLAKHNMPSLTRTVNEVLTDLVSGETRVRPDERT